MQHPRLFEFAHIHDTQMRTARTVSKDKQRANSLSSKCVWCYTQAPTQPVHICHSIPKECSATCGPAKSRHGTKRNRCSTHDSLSLRTFSTHGCVRLEKQTKTNTGQMHSRANVFG